MPEPKPPSGTPEDFLELLVRSFDGALSQEESRVLNERLRQDPRCREAYVQYCLHAQMIRKACSSVSAAAEAETAGPSSTRRAYPSTRRLRVIAGGSRPNPWNLGLTAAAVLFGLVVLIILLSAGDERKPVAKVGHPQSSEPARTKPQAALENDAQAEARQRATEERLQEIQKKREQLSSPPVLPVPTPVDEEKRRKEIEELQGEKERIERELREATGNRSPTPKEARPPAPEAPKGDKPEGQTQAALARIEEAAGAVLLVTKEGKSPAAAGGDLLPGQAIETGGGESRVVLRFPDNTKVEIGPDTVVSEVKVESGKRLLLAMGVLSAQISRQPKDEPMIFATPHGEAKVLGTTLKLLVDSREKGFLRLDVEEGKVQLRNLEGKTVEVVTGHYAVAAAGTELVSKVLPIDDILLLAPQGKKVGEEWRLLKDEKASAGQAWEAISVATRLPSRTLFQEYNDAVARIKARSAAFVEFRFTADADRDYLIWVRGACLAKGNAGFDQPIYHYDQVLIEFLTGQVSKPSANVSGMYLANGYAMREGYWWVGGDAWMSKELIPPTGKPLSDEVPVSVRFGRPGPQILRMYAGTSVQRIDAIRLSTIQKTRPEGPGAARN